MQEESKKNRINARIQLTFEYAPESESNNLNRKLYSSSPCGGSLNDHPPVMSAELNAIDGSSKWLAMAEKMRTLFLKTCESTGENEELEMKGQEEEELTLKVIAPKGI